MMHEIPCSCSLDEVFALYRLFSALLSLGLGYLAQTFGLQNVMFWMVTVPYAINAVFWFVFYRAYPRDVAAQQARNAAQASVDLSTYVRTTRRG